jgi:hypothetical protein
MLNNDNIIGWLMARSTQAPGTGVFRHGKNRRPQPLEYIARSARIEMVE